MEIYSPWYGGFWESLVGLTKSALKKIFGRRHISLTLLETVIAEIEAVINDHPLIFVSSELGDVEPLTPAPLLHGRRITYLLHEMVDTDEIIDPSYTCMGILLLFANEQGSWHSSCKIFRRDGDMTTLHH